jgi:hypothetical protein
MLIDAFSEDWLDVLYQRAAELPVARKMYLLLDGAFVPGLHRRLHVERKAILFAALRGCTDEVRDVSPFLAPFSPDEKVLKSLLSRSNRWPMVSVIATPELLEQLTDRLAAWCVVEADGQRFNFRFPDTRRLPAIFGTLSPVQRAQIAGPATSWSFIGRDGRWCELELDGCDMDIAAEPVLDQRQFAHLVADSRVDEVLVLLNDRGAQVFRHPSRSHALLMAALRAAHMEQLPDDALLDWCEWFWRQDRLHDDSGAVSMLQAWRNDFSRKD